ncbi:hypothetical protein L1887_38899 [Cichorium endivia]|nr:hypothetical protein L1887_38899 [Cichorium endivia]
MKGQQRERLLSALFGGRAVVADGVGSYMVAGDGSVNCDRCHARERKEHDNLVASVVNIVAVDRLPTSVAARLIVGGGEKCYETVEGDGLGSGVAYFHGSKEIMKFNLETPPIGAAAVSRVRLPASPATSCFPLPLSHQLLYHICSHHRST